MKKAITGLGAVVLVLTMVTAASAQTTLWNDDDVIDSDSLDVEVAVLAQEATVSITGPDTLDTDEQGQYTVGVINDSDVRDLDNWVLGLRVTNIDDAEDITIRFAGVSGDMSDGTGGVSVEVVDDILYMRGDTMDPPIEVGDSLEIDFDVIFHKAGSFTGTAYVLEFDG